MLNIKILNITHNIQSKNKIQNPSASLADMAADMMNCDNCDNCDNREANRDSRKENDNVNLLGNNQQGESREWTEIKISK
jgi:hypothetical protein